jgi:Protein of unknown function (DUF4236)
MGRIVVTEFVSLDGVMEDPGGSENFAQGGWSFKISRGDEGDKFKLDASRDRRRRKVPSRRRVLRAPLRQPVPATRLPLHPVLRERRPVPAHARLDELDYRRSRRLSAGVRLNLSKRGLVLSAGLRGAKLSVNSRRGPMVHLSALGFFLRKRL